MERVDDGCPRGSVREHFLFELKEPVAKVVAALPADAVEQVLDDHIRQARDAWPDVKLPVDRFLAHLARQYRADDSKASGLDELRNLRASDLYIACACAEGNARAIVAFERFYFGEIGAAAVRARARPSIADEVKQILRRVFFVAEPGRSPAIAGYSGRGDVRGWVRISAMRTTIRLLNREKHHVAADDDVLSSALPSTDDLELRYLRIRYQAAFAAAFRDALAATSPEHRRLLRYQLVDRLTVGDIGRLQGVHRATAARRIAAARTGIRDRTRLALRAEIGLSCEDVDHVIQMLHGELDISIEGNVGQSGLMRCRSASTTTSSG